MIESWNTPWWPNVIVSEMKIRPCQIVEPVILVYYIIIVVKLLIHSNQAQSSVIWNTTMHHISKSKISEQYCNIYAILYMAIWVTDFHNIRDLWWCKNRTKYFFKEVSGTQKYSFKKVSGAQILNRSFITGILCNIIVMLNN